MEVGTLVMQGWLRKQVKKSKNLGISYFPARYFVLDRTSGSLVIYSVLGDTFS